MASESRLDNSLMALTHPHSEAAEGTSATVDSARANNAYAVHETPPVSALPTLSFKRRKHSKARTGRSSSTPLSTYPPGMSESDIDKRRNKLGYQRISIACAHCRRRKIRCVVDERDSQQRCQNCIRLKKECLFYPVEQQSMMEERSQSSSKAGPPSTVSSSPADIGSGRSFDEHESQSDFSSLPPTIRSNDHVARLRTESPAQRQGSFTPAEHEFPQHHENLSPWIDHGAFDPRAHPARPSPISISEPNQQYWHMNQGGSPGDYAPFPLDSMQPHSNHHNAQTFSYPPQRLDPMWQQGGRSVSYGHVSRSLPNTHAVYGSGYHLLSPAHNSSPHDMRDPSLVAQQDPAHYSGIGQQQSFSDPAHHYNNSTMLHDPYSENWYSGSPSLEQTQDEHRQARSERSTQYGQR